MRYNNIVLQYILQQIFAMIQFVHYEHHKSLQNEK